MTPIQELIILLQEKSGQTIDEFVKRHNIDLSFNALGEYGDLILHACYDCGHYNNISSLILLGFEIEKYPVVWFDKFVEHFNLDEIKLCFKKNWCGENAIEVLLLNDRRLKMKSKDRIEVFQFLIEHKIPHQMHDKHPLFDIDLETYQYLLTQELSYWFPRLEWAEKIHQKFNSFPYSLSEKERKDLSDGNCEFLYNFILVSNSIALHLFNFTLCPLAILKEIYQLAPHDLKHIFSYLKMNQLFMFKLDVVKFILNTVRPHLEITHFEQSYMMDLNIYYKQNDYISIFPYLYQNHYYLFSQKTWFHYFLEANNQLHEDIGLFLDLLHLNDLNHLLFEFLSVYNYLTFSNTMDYIFDRNGASDNEYELLNAIIEGKDLEIIQDLIENKHINLEIANGFFLALAMKKKNDRIGEYLLQFIYPNSDHYYVVIEHDNFYLYQLMKKKTQPVFNQEALKNIFNIFEKEFFDTLIQDYGEIDFTYFYPSFNSKNPIQEYIFQYVINQIINKKIQNLYFIDMFCASLLGNHMLTQYQNDLINLIHNSIEEKKRQYSFIPSIQNSEFKFHRLNVSNLIENKNFGLLLDFVQKGYLNIKQDVYILYSLNFSTLSTHDREMIKQLSQFIHREEKVLFLNTLIDFEDNKTLAVEILEKQALATLVEFLCYSKLQEKHFLFTYLKQFIFDASFIQNKFNLKKLELLILKNFWRIQELAPNIIDEFNQGIERKRLDLALQDSIMLVDDKKIKKI